MFKRMMSGFLALVLVAGMLPMPAQAEELEQLPPAETTAVTEAVLPESTAATEGSLCAHAYGEDCALCGLENRIDSLPGYEELGTLEGDAYASAIEAVQTAQMDYYALPEEQQSQIRNRDILLTLLAAPENQPEAILSGTCGDNATWTLEDGILTISGKGYMTLYSSGGAPWYQYRNMIFDVVIESGIACVGRYAFASCDSLETVTLPASITYIGSDAFRMCTNLKSINIPANVTEIESLAFFACESLEEITLPGKLKKMGDEVFSCCMALKKITIPESLAQLERGVFYKCTALEEVTIQGGLGYIYNDCFYGCTALKTITFEGDYGRIFDSAFSGVTADAYYPAGNATWTQDKLQNYGGQLTWNPLSAAISGTCGAQGDNLTWVLEDGVLTISGTGAMVNYSMGTGFAYRNDVTTLILEDGVTTIGENAFSHWTNLTYVEIADTVTRIGTNAFQNCTRLKSVALPRGFSQGGYNAFYGCTGLTDVTIPEGVTTIGGNMFAGCTGLTRVVLPKTIQNMDFQPFGGVLKEVHITDLGAWCRIKFADEGGHGDAQNNPLRGAALYLNGDLVTDLVIPEGITKIKHEAFSGCTSLTSVTIPETVTAIDTEAFANCVNLKKITIPESVKSIGYASFWGCSSLEEITIPRDVSQLGYYMFWQCTGLKTVTFQGDAPEITADAFRDVTATVYYPAGNTTWTQDKLQNYGGQLTWIPDYRNCPHPQERLTYVEAKPAGCEEYGRKAHFICQCGFYLTADTLEETTLEALTLPAAGHSWNEGEITTEPTCTSDGEKTFTCARCQETRTEVVKTPGHTKAPVPAVEPGCMETGLTEGENCSACGEVFLEQLPVPAMGHKVHNGICQNCGQEVPAHDHGAEDSFASPLVQAMVWEGFSLEEGSYYLQEDLQLTGTLKIQGQVRLCLNGCSITGIPTERVLWVLENGSLDLYDCGTGSITGGDGGVLISGDMTMHGGSISGNLCSSEGTSGGGVLVMDGGSFTLQNGTITANCAMEYGDGVHVAMGGSFTMNGGSVCSNGQADIGRAGVTVAGSFTLNDGIISGNNSVIFGGGVHVYHPYESDYASLAEDTPAGYAGGSFTMNGGTITGNRCMHGAGVYVLNSASFTMNGGSITGNNGAFGSGVQNVGLFRMNGGTICDNTGAVMAGGIQNSGTAEMTGGSILRNDGSGVYNDGVFTMSGGEIRENAQSGVHIRDGIFTLTGEGRIANNLAQDTGLGGGVYIANEGGMAGTFTMEGGTITGHSAKRGGGVYAASSFVMTGGTITGNEATENGGGVWFDDTITLGGIAQIQGNTLAGKANNVLLRENQRITVSAEGLEDSACIGVTSLVIPTEDVPVTEKSTADYSSAFVSDRENEQMKNEDNTVVLYHHVHNFVNGLCSCGLLQSHKTVTETIGPKEPNDTEYGHTAFSVTLCTDCGAWLKEDGTTMTQEEMEALYEAHRVYADARSVVLTLADGGEIPETWDLAEGTALALKASVLPVTAEQIITWKTSSNKVAQVNEEGLVTFLSNGSVTITATGPDRRSASVKITILTKAQSLTVDTPVSVAIGQSAALNALIQPETVTVKTLTWTVEPEFADYVTVSNKGVVTVKKTFPDSGDGFTVVPVTVETNDGSGLSQVISLHVYPKAAGLQLLDEAGDQVPAAVTLGLEETLILTANVLPENARQEVVWKTSNTKVAQVDSEGTVMPLGTGTATITATAADGSGKRASVKIKVVQYVQSVTISGSNVVGGGKRLSLTAEVEPANASNKALAWSVESDLPKLSISSSGALSTPKVEEVATVIVTAAAKDGSGAYDRFVVTLSPAATGVDILLGEQSVSKQTLTLGTGEILSLGALVQPLDAHQEVTWKSGSEKVARVDEQGNVYPAAPGTAAITASAVDGSGKSVSVKVRVVEYVRSLTVEKTAVMAVGKTASLHAEVQPENATDKTLKWTVDSAFSSYLTVSSKGVVSMKKPMPMPETGCVQVPVTVETTDGSGLSEQILLEIYPLAAAVSLYVDGIAANGDPVDPALEQLLTTAARADGKTLILGSNQELTLSGTIDPTYASQELTWKSSSTAVATVEDGVITPVKTGTTTITATAADGSGKKAAVKVKVVRYVESVTITGAEAVAAGKSLTLKAAVFPETASDKTLTWTLEAEDTAGITLNSRGVLSTKALAEPRTVTVIASAADGSGAQAAMEVTVCPAVTALGIYDGTTKVSGTTVTLGIGQELDLQAIADPDSAWQEVTWKSSSTKVAEVEAGLVTAQNPGTATITATAVDGSGRKAAVTVKVVRYVESITLTGQEGVAGGKRLTLTAEVFPANATKKTLVWSLLDAEGTGAAISSRGVLTTKAVSEETTVTVLATAADGSGAEAFVDVTIYPAATSVTLYDGETQVSGTTVTLAPEEELSLFALVGPETAWQEVTWKSSNTRSVQVEEDGLVSAIKAGSATITATAKDGSGKKTTVKVTVKQP